MMEVVRGGTAVLRAEFVDNSGDPITVFVDGLEILDPAGEVFYDVPLVDIVTTGIGSFRYDFYVPESAEDGEWTARWTARNIESEILIGEEPFDVLVVDDETLLTVPQLRMLINERIPPAGSEDDTKFTDNELALILERNGMYLYASASEGWYVKAGMGELFINVDESGSNRNMEDIFKHALMMGDRYAKAHSGEMTALGVAIEGRIPGRAISPWKTTPEDASIYPFPAYNTTYTRWFPTARFMFSPMG